MPTRDRSQSTAEPEQDPPVAPPASAPDPGGAGGERPGRPEPAGGAPAPERAAAPRRQPARAHCSAALSEERQLMHTLATLARTAASPATAASLIAAAVPSVLRLAPQVQRSLWPALPALIETAADAACRLHRSPATRPAIESLPVALERAAAQLAYRVACGQPAGPEVAARLLARQIARLLPGGAGPE